MADEPRRRPATTKKSAKRDAPTNETTERAEPEASAPTETRPAAAPTRQPPSVVWLFGAIAAVIAIVLVARARRQEEAVGEELVITGRDGERRDDERETPEPGTTEPGTAEPGTPVPERLRVNVIRSFPHDSRAFTQGLLWHEGHLYESTGQYRRSSLRRVALESGEVLERRDLEPRIFAEGLARVGDRLYQLSWQEGQAFVWSLPAFEPVRTFEYDGEGWGLCHDGTHLVMSDGSDELFFRDPETFEIVRRVQVRERGRPLDQLNELECVDGVVWANVWQTERIVRIDPRSGHVTAVVDARGLLDDEEREDADVLNGIAWIPERGHFVITGKYWPRMFEVEMVPR
ncbi:glutaminyl-peptide cyclotransferase [Sandaracinus amylolyticus]|uniref:Glutamine cyclotransferase n=1 Tax=Sandaracinus amylolyticus TaxID=927083 RepID=A0A0F6SD71_9BACT|nr:glutaminyl-peptide cyclotransferase [Sandaracinus amylolyticus]AKF02934.1 glutamine cyclotransferase [Sandaracinus amylolyticus]